MRCFNNSSAYFEREFDSTENEQKAASGMTLLTFGWKNDFPKKGNSDVSPTLEFQMKWYQRKSIEIRISCVFDFECLIKLLIWSPFMLQIPHFTLERVEINLSGTFEQKLLEPGFSEPLISNMLLEFWFGLLMLYNSICPFSNERNWLVFKIWVHIGMRVFAWLIDR